MRVKRVGLFQNVPLPDQLEGLRALLTREGLMNEELLNREKGT